MAVLNGDRVAYAVLRELSKAYFLGVGVSVRAVSRVYGVRPGSAYGYLRKLGEEGVAVKEGASVRLRSPAVARAFMEVLEAEAERLGLGEAERVLYLRVPDTLYYVATVSGRAFAPAPSVLVVDREAYSRLGNREKEVLRGFFGTVVAGSLRGRRRFFSWECMLALAEEPQAYADVLSYHPRPGQALYALVYSAEAGLESLSAIYGCCREGRCKKLLGAVAEALGISNIPHTDPASLTESDRAVLYEGLKALSEIPKLLNSVAC